MQQDHGRARAICRIPDSRAVVIDVAVIACDRQGRGAVRCEIAEVVVVRFHSDLARSAQGRPRGLRPPLPRFKPSADSNPVDARRRRAVCAQDDSRTVHAQPDWW